MRTYGQFCPVAKVAEVFAERWPPLIVRELGAGSRRFTEIEQGVPRILRSILSRRLRALEEAGIVERRPGCTGRTPEYHLTPRRRGAARDRDALGRVGQRWVSVEISVDELDPILLLWDMHRRIHLERLPDRRVVVQFNFVGARRDRIWLVLERPEPSVCLTDPGWEVDLYVTADTLALHQVWLGHRDLANALRDGLIALDGPAELRRAFPGWLALNALAGIKPAVAPPSATATATAAS